ncbi:hypothetical protein HYD77_00875 [Mycoplasmopsis bovis]|nr:hypothetical protein [Mycoplasmopsis bovis]QQH43519.1 hypothetical protein HYD77_00875 [Mycoplasmopsis bovis]
MNKMNMTGFIDELYTLYKKRNKDIAWLNDVSKWWWFSLHWTRVIIYMTDTFLDERILIFDYSK